MSSTGNCLPCSYRRTLSPFTVPRQLLLTRVELVTLCTRTSIYALARSLSRATTFLLACVPSALCCDLARERVGVVFPRRNLRAWGALRSQGRAHHSQSYKLHSYGRRLLPYSRPRGGWIPCPLSVWWRAEGRLREERENARAVILDGNCKLLTKGDLCFVIWRSCDYWSSGLKSYEGCDTVSHPKNKKLP